MEHDSTQLLKLETIRCTWPEVGQPTGGPEASTSLIEPVMPRADQEFEDLLICFHLNSRLIVVKGVPFPSQISSATLV